MTVQLDELVNHFTESLKKNDTWSDFPLQTPHWIVKVSKFGNLSYRKSDWPLDTPAQEQKYSAQRAWKPLGDAGISNRENFTALLNDDSAAAFTRPHIWS